MWCGMLPTYDTKECANVAEALLLDKPIKLHGSIPTKLSTVINGFLQEDPDARMNYDQAYNLLGEYLSELPEDKSEIVPDSGTKPVSDKETEVRVEYVDMNGSVLESTTLTLACGSTLTVFPKTIDGYESIDGKRDVRVDESGHAEPSSIIFKYKKRVIVRGCGLSQPWGQYCYGGCLQLEVQMQQSAEATGKRLACIAHYALSLMLSTPMKCSPSIIIMGFGYIIHDNMKKR